MIYEAGETTLSTEKVVTTYRLNRWSNCSQNFCDTSLLHSLVMGHDTFLNCKRLRLLQGVTEIMGPTIDPLLSKV